MSESVFQRAKRVIVLTAVVRHRWRARAAAFLGVGQRSLHQWCRDWGYDKHRITAVPEADRRWLIEFLGGSASGEDQQRREIAQRQEQHAEQLRQIDAAHRRALRQLRERHAEEVRQLHEQLAWARSQTPYEKRQRLDQLNRQ